MSSPSLSHDSHDSHDGNSSAGSKYSSAFRSSLMHSANSWINNKRPLLPHQEAALLLEYARDGQDLDGSELTQMSRLCYRLRHKFQWLLRTAAWGAVLVHIFERPIWTYSVADWRDGDVYPSYEMPYMGSVAAKILGFLLTLTMSLGVGLEFGYKQLTNNAYLTYLSAAILLARLVLLSVALARISQDLPATFSASPIEGFMVLLVELQYDNNIAYLLRTIPKFCVLMLGLALAVGSYATLGFFIFDPESEEKKLYFPVFGTGVWNMLVVLNGSNWPGPMIPALDENRLYCLYFFVYIVLAGWGFLNLVLGFVYLFFQQEQRFIFDLQEATRVNNKKQAFQILDIECKGYLTYVQVDELLQEMYAFYEDLSLPPTAAERYELILVLDVQSNLRIDESDFHFIQEKCFRQALKTLRAKKLKFTRFLSANIIRQG
eukprot:CAMPEP_0173339604 /NCGR_PEP_ID=MMETSP1144-20121109/8465_1 /TAXON_ID=483371 /ORGANISM="non described non described, Strain CCMP2298" /LENGTH=432 /DNA_ID=CAMNT_0014285547 /DNA_START=258 /DNA_END=1553 /DNA_ORIENTATION=+